MEHILDLAKKAAEEAEVYFVKSKDTPVGWESNRLKLMESSESTAVSLRIIKNGRIGFASTTRLDDPQALVDMAVDTSQFGAEARFSFPEPQSYPQVAVHDGEVDEIDVDEMVAMGNDLVARLIAHEPELVCEGQVAKSESEVRILNSRGGQAEYLKSYFAVAIEGTLIRDTDMLFVGDMDVSCHPIRDIQKLAESTVEQLELARRTASISTGSYPVILTPKGVINAFSTPMALAVNGKMVLEGASPLGGRLGEQMFDSALTIWDDPTVDYRPASRPCDGEGVPSQRTPLIENGVVRNFLYDLQTAALAGGRSTGSGSRARGGLPAPSTSAVIINEGATAYTDMLRDIKEGLVVEMLIGAGQGNVLGGEFSGNVLLGYKVENGEIVGRVKDTMISGNMYDVLKEITAIGSESEWVAGALRTPAIYLSSMAVASKV
ncbi:MAG: TldD/PmbA family protein [Chloroflexota bacterium]|nr:TldD/PmbA family protein [Chloroflexota bacterium]